jgi:hypothetical protein
MNVAPSPYALIVNVPFIASGTVIVPSATRTSSES